MRAVTWYERQQPGLGHRFLDDLDEAFATIRHGPLASPVWEGGAPHRKFVLRRFPYVVFYAVGEADVEIVALAHCRRKPGYWLRRP